MGSSHNYITYTSVRLLLLLAWWCCPITSAVNLNKFVVNH